MINRNKPLKESLTNEEYENIVRDATQFSDVSLPIWHLEIVGKCLVELSSFDLIRCIRQDVYTDLAIFEIIERIDEQNTPFYADLDSIELMEKLSSVSSERLSVYKKRIDRIIENIEKNNLIDLADIWIFDEEKETYKGYINKLKNKF